VHKAALHVHSTYSDGEFAIPELREKFLGAGCDVVCMADHADAFDEGKLAHYVTECKRHSDQALLFLPGLEFGCIRRMHIVGYGVVSLVDSDDPETVISHIRRSDGIAVIAHPPDALFTLIEGFDILPDGIEGWNSKYDGRYAPRPATFELIRRLQHRQPSLKAFYGQDLHWRKQYAGLFTLLDAEGTEPAAVLAALARGRFEGAKGSIRLPSNGHIDQSTMEAFARASQRSQRFRSAVKFTRKLMGGVVDHFPPSLKAQLRRFF
jgi:predicted metal-dependent phosphoesterase TrpH